MHLIAVQNIAEVQKWCLDPSILNRTRAAEAASCLEGRAIGVGLRNNGVTLSQEAALQLRLLKAGHELATLLFGTPHVLGLEPRDGDEADDGLLLLCFHRIRVTWGHVGICLGL